MESVNIGVIGCGQIGMDIVRRVVGCNPQLRVVALYDPDQNSLDRAQSELTSSDHGLVALAKGQGAFNTHCAKISTELAGKVKGNSKDIEELKSTVSRRRR